MDLYLENDRLLLRALEPEDLTTLYAWENDSSLWHTANTLTPFSRYVLKKYIAESHLNIYESKQLRLMVCLKENAQAIGTIDLFDFDAHHRKAEIGIFIDQTYQKQGYAKEAFILFQTYVFDFLHLHQIYAHIAVSNKACLSLHESCGFKICATLRDWSFTPNGFEDVYILQNVYSPGL